MHAKKLVQQKRLEEAYQEAEKIPSPLAKEEVYFLILEAYIQREGNVTRALSISKKFTLPNMKIRAQRLIAACQKSKIEKTLS